MKTYTGAIAIAISTSSPFFATAEGIDDSPSLEQCFPNDIPWYRYHGKDYIFTRQKYNSVCVDSKGEQYEYGKVNGVYPPIDEPDGGCSKICVAGYGRGQQRGCNSMKPGKLVGFNYNCSENACYCLYQAGTWSGVSSPCFDSMDTSFNGAGEVASTTVQQGSTCYSLFVQPAPAPTPARAPGSSICVRSPDYDCYKSGRPACCDDDDYTCPDHMTMCDNHPHGWTGTSYCTYPPDYNCYDDGWPACCSEPGGDVMNCPVDQPECEKEPPAPAPGSSICVRSPDHECYKSGRPACCDDDNYTCPDYMTMCDNYPEDWTGTSYCTQAPDYGCYPSDGWPSCCSEPGGDVMNCPVDKPACENGGDFMTNKFVKYLRAHQK